MIKPSIALTIGLTIVRVLPALLLMLGFLSLGSLLLLAAPVSAEQRDYSPNLFTGTAAGSFGQPTVDQPETDDNPTDTEDTPAIAYPVGIFITSLHDLDPIGGSFGVDY